MFDVGYFPPNTPPDRREVGHGPPNDIVPHIAGMAGAAEMGRK
jgi:hypothetical protein